MTTQLLLNFIEVKPVKPKTEWWLSLLGGDPRRYRINGDNGYHIFNGVNGTSAVQPGRVEPLPPYWLNLLNGGQNYNGNRRGPVSTPLPAVEIDAEFWLKILEGK
ncbi:MAG: hypothetical protein KDI79_22560 [Anaerolineae bacterium]|nr:hypothetical protein [Anaerolineae bacterium]